MSPELQELFNRGKQLGDAVRLLRDARIECLAFSDYGWKRINNAMQHIGAQVCENSALIESYFSPEVAA